MVDNNSREVVEYIGGMCEALAAMTGRLPEAEQLRTGIYLLRMASLEYRTQCDCLTPGPAAETAAG